MVISFYGFIVGLAIVIGIDYFHKHSKYTNFPYFLVAFSLIGARLYHVVEQWSYYSQNPVEIIATWHGGLSILGAILFGFGFILIYSRIYRVSSYELLNTITPILPLCQAIGRLGNWVNRENPLWWPEAILDLLLFFFIKRYPHHPTAKYFIGYGLIRFLTEFWRQDTWVIGSLKVGQLVSLFLIVTGILLYRINYNKK